MSPAWPTVKLVREPADEPSVADVRSEGDAASCVICVMSMTTFCGLVAPVVGMVSVNVGVPPEATLPWGVNTTLAAGASATVTPVAVVVADTLHVSAVADLV